MDLKLKTISKSGIGEAIAKAELYRYLNEPEEAESICRDILVADPNHMLGLRTLGLTITDQFTGGPGDRYAEVEKIFLGLKDPRGLNDVGPKVQGVIVRGHWTKPEA